MKDGFPCSVLFARPKGARAPTRRPINGSASGASLSSPETTVSVRVCVCVARGGGMGRMFGIKGDGRREEAGTLGSKIQRIIQQVRLK